MADHCHKQGNKSFWPGLGWELEQQAGSGYILKGEANQPSNALTFFTVHINTHKILSFRHFFLNVISYLFCECVHAFLIVHMLRLEDRHGSRFSFPVDPGV